MEKIIAYVDDAAYAKQQLLPMLTAAGRTHWVLVACAPRMTRRISKWVSHTARENWRNKWAEKLYGELLPLIEGRGDPVLTVLAKGPLAELTERLLAEHGAAHVMDARRPKFGQDMQPVTADQPAPNDGRWTVPGAVAGMGVVLVLAGE